MPRIKGSTPSKHMRLRATGRPERSKPKVEKPDRPKMVLTAEQQTIVANNYQLIVCCARKGTRYTRRPDLYDDFLGECMLAACRAVWMHREDGGANVMTYITGFCRYAIIDHVKKLNVQSRKSSRAISLEHLVPGTDKLTYSESIPDYREVQAPAAAEIRDSAAYAYGHCTEPEKYMVTKIAEGMRMADIGLGLGMSRAWANVLRCRMKRRMAGLSAEIM